jgi:hypothetical protein
MQAIDKAPVKSTNYGTPIKYLEVVRALFGGQIDLDPASSPAFNRIVKARRIFTAKDNALQLTWSAENVFCNPPYRERQKGESQPIHAVFIETMLHEYYAGRFAEGVLLVNAIVAAGWFKQLWDYPRCFTDHRIQFYQIEHGRAVPMVSPRLSQVFIYLPPLHRDTYPAKLRLFRDLFAPLGHVELPPIVDGGDA